MCIKNGTLDLLTDLFMQHCLHVMLFAQFGGCFGGHSVTCRHLTMSGSGQLTLRSASVQVAYRCKHSGFFSQQLCASVLSVVWINICLHAQLLSALVLQACSYCSCEARGLPAAWSAAALLGCPIPSASPDYASTVGRHD